MEILIAYFAGFMTPCVGFVLIALVFYRDKSAERTIIQMSREDE